MLRAYYPDAYAESVFDIDFQKLYDRGFRGLLFDIDNTLVHHGDDSNPKVDALFRQLHDMGFQTYFVSDNGEERIRRFLRNIPSPYIANAGKPDPAGYRKALDAMKLPTSQAVFIGDQIFTDILGANRSGIPSILVHFIRAEGETAIGKRRYVEFGILWCWRHSRKALHRLGDIKKKEA